MDSYLPEQALAEQARAVLLFWFGEPPEYGTPLKRWFEKDPAFDAGVRDIVVHGKAIFSFTGRFIGTMGWSGMRNISSHQNR